MGTQVFVVFAPRAPGASFLAFAARITGIALLVIVSSPILLGQMHGIRAAGRPVRIGAGPQVRPGFSGSRNGAIGSRPLAHRPFAVKRFPFRHHRHFNVFVANACFNDPFFDPFLCRRFFFRNSLFFAEPLLLPYPIYADASYGEPEQSVLAEQHEQSDLGIRIDRLAGEVERLREEQESTKNQQQTPNLGKQSEPSPPTRILVFRDGHHSEIQNYATVGNTLWVLTEEKARKIPISDLDMDATKKANADQGVEFP